MYTSGVDVYIDLGDRVRQRSIPPPSGPEEWGTNSSPPPGRKTETARTLNGDRDSNPGVRFGFCRCPSGSARTAQPPRATSCIKWWNELNREFRVWSRRSLLYLRGWWSRWCGRQRWRACVAGAGWGFRHRGSFSESRLVLRACHGIESVSSPRSVPPFRIFSPAFGPVFSRSYLFRDTLRLVGVDVYIKQG